MHDKSLKWKVKHLRKPTLKRKKRLFIKEYILAIRGEKDQGVESSVMNLSVKFKSVIIIPLYTRVKFNGFKSEDI